MRTFAYITTPINTEQLKEQWQALKYLPDYILSRLRKLLPKYKIIKLGKFESVQAETIKGYKIVCPILDEYKQDNLVLERIISACCIAEKLGVKLIGVGGYAALVADKNYNKIIKSVKIPVTCGNALSAWCLFEKVYRLAKAKNIPLKGSTILFLGADTQTGSLAARKLSEYTAKIIIAGTDKNLLAKLKEVILQENHIEVIIESNIEAALNEVSIVVNAEEAYEPLPKLKENTIYSGVEALRIREYGAGVSRFISPSLAEAALLVLDDNAVSYSLGKNSNLEILEEIANTAVRQGFEVWVPEAPVL
ncbi:MAG: hypothetical protein ABSE81_03505 [Candidatus Omnitrophota bacterium]|jgi:predicted amino acid dehydrogenase